MICGGRRAVLLTSDPPCAGRRASALAEQDPCIDRLIPPAYASEFKSRIKDTRLQTIKDAGHLPMYEQQAEFCRAVRDFLKG